MCAIINEVVVIENGKFTGIFPEKVNGDKFKAACFL